MTSIRKKLIFKPNLLSTIYNNIDITELKEPVSITREEMVSSEPVYNSKIRSVILDYETEEYKMLKKEEGMPLIITDSKGREYHGKLQTFIGDSSYYLAFFEGKNEIVVTLIYKWYVWGKRVNATIDGSEKVIEDISKRINTDYDEGSVEDEEDEIDYDERFDDDDDNDRINYITKKKEIDPAGEKILSIINDYNSEKEHTGESEHPNGKNDNNNNVKKQKNELTESALIKLMGKQKITIKDLVANIKNEFTLGEREKVIIKEFIKTKCNSVTKGPNEIYFYLK